VCRGLYVEAVGTRSGYGYKEQRSDSRGVRYRGIYLIHNVVGVTILLMIWTRVGLGCVVE